MKLRVLALLPLIALTANAAHAASEKVDAAVKTFNAIASDPGKLQTFCAMSKSMTAGDNEKDATKLAAIDKEVDGYMQSLGQDFQTAWNAGEELDPETPDGKAYYGALEGVSGKCSK